MSLEKRAEEIKAQVRGFLVPEFTTVLPDGRRLNGLYQKDFERVMEGYACGECLAMFDHYTVTCPVCHASRLVEADIQRAPQIWLDHLHERNRKDAPAFVPSTFDEAMKEKLG